MALSPSDPSGGVFTRSLHSGDLDFPHIPLPPPYTEAMAKADPKEINAILQSALMSHRAGNLQEAEAGYRKVLSLNPRHPDAMRLLGLIAISAGMYADGIDLLERAVALAPKTLPYLMDLANAHRHIGHREETVKVLRQAAALAPNDGLVLAQLADALKFVGRFEEALEIVDRTLVMNPRALQLLATKATTLEKLSRHEEALQVVRDGFKMAEDASVPVPMLLEVIFAQLAPKAGAADEAIERVKSAVQTEGVDPRLKASALFAAAKIEAQRDNHDVAFALYEHANTAVENKWNADAHSGVIDSLMNTYSPERCAAMRRSHNTSETAVFVLGMPRSGTTLVEQILGAHSDVVPMGELLDIWDLARRMSMETRTQYMTSQFMDAVTTSMLDDASKRYTSRHRTFARGAKRVTDKLPTNFLNLGLIAQMLPGARVIHCVRDPMDTCWSNYTTDYTTDMPFARRLSAIGQYYRDYQRLMDHWKSVLDIQILDVQYEQLVANPEAESRRMLEFLELDWDESVLRYYESDRPILTASYEQANQPIYTSSIGRYKPYESKLDDLKKALEPVGAS